MSMSKGKPTKTAVKQTSAILKKIEVPGSGSDKRAAKDMPMSNKMPAKQAPKVADKGVKKAGRGR